jgi:methionyl-tRNA formyltransferase
MNITFAGTPKLAAVILEALLGDRAVTVREVWSQPDRPAGRGRRPKPGEVATLAARHRLPLWQPERILSAPGAQRLRSSGSQVLVVAAYGQLLPGALLDVPPLGCINVHASLLPRWRGAAPVQRAILAGDSVTGITIMRMVAELDAGPMLLQRSCPIHAEETAASLHDRLAELGADTLLEALPLLASGEAIFTEQDPDQVTYAAKIDKREAWLDWSAPAAELERKVRAFNPSPGARSRLLGLDLKLWSAQIVEPAAPAQPGQIVAVGPTGIDVACGTGCLRISRLQEAGKRPLTAREFVNGHPQFRPPAS